MPSVLRIERTANLQLCRSSVEDSQHIRQTAPVLSNCRARYKYVKPLTTRSPFSLPKSLRHPHSPSSSWIRCLLQATTSTMPVPLASTPSQARPYLRLSTPSYYRTTPSEPFGTQHMFSSSSRYSAQVSFQTPRWVEIVRDLPPLSVRVTAFVMRAVLAGSDGAGSDLGLVIGEMIVYSVGFFGLLYSVYNLVLDR